MRTIVRVGFAAHQSLRFQRFDIAGELSFVPRLVASQALGCLREIIDNHLPASPPVNR